MKTKDASRTKAGGRGKDKGIISGGMNEGMSEGMNDAVHLGTTERVSVSKCSKT